MAVCRVDCLDCGLEIFKELELQVSSSCRPCEHRQQHHHPAIRLREVRIDHLAALVRMR
eukprot:SAG31_NODE_5655_length_2402_cov_12.288754_2_plen_59_part_00